MKKIATVEWMYFGIGKMAAAAAERGAVLHALSQNPDKFDYDLSLNDPAGALVRHRVDTTDPGAIEKVFEEIGGIDGLITPTEHSAFGVFEYLAGLGLPGHDPDSIRIIRDKSRLRQRLAEAGLSRSTGVVVDLETADWRGLTDRLGSPFIVKDRSGSASKDVWLVASQEEYDSFHAAAGAAGLSGRLTAESYFNGPLFSAETVSWDGDTKVLGVGGRVMARPPNFREDFYSFPVDLPPDMDAEIRDWIPRVFEAVGYTHGVSHTEFIMTTDGFEIVEINPRLGGGPAGDMFEEAVGVNLYEVFVDMALGRRPEPLDRELRTAKGTGLALVYPPVPGVLAGVDGGDRLAGHPGSPILHVTHEPGFEVPDVTNMWGLVAFIMTTAPTSELALLHAMSAAGKLNVRMDPLPR